MAVYLIEQNMYRDTSSFKDVATVIEIKLKNYPDKFILGNEDIAKLLNKSGKYEATELEGSSIIHVALSDKKYIEDIKQILDKNNIVYDLGIAYGYEDVPDDSLDLSIDIFNSIEVCLIKTSEVFIHGNALHFISQNTGSLDYPIRKYNWYFPASMVYKYNKNTYCINYNILKELYNENYEYDFNDFLREFNIEIEFISKKVYYSLKQIKVGDING